VAVTATPRLALGTLRTIPPRAPEVDAADVGQRHRHAHVLRMVDAQRAGDGDAAERTDRVQVRSRREPDVEIRIAHDGGDVRAPHRSAR
jgi:hypothetical protein